MTEVVDCATPLLEALNSSIETQDRDRTRARFQTVEPVVKVMVVTREVRQLKSG